MPRMISTAEMITALERALAQLEQREADFVRSLAQLRDAGEVTRLSEPQVDWLAGLYARYCA